MTITQRKVAYENDDEKHSGNCRDDDFIVNLVFHVSSLRIPAACRAVHVLDATDIAAALFDSPLLEVGKLPDSSRFGMPVRVGNVDNGPTWNLFAPVRLLFCVSPRDIGEFALQAVLSKT